MLSAGLSLKLLISLCHMWNGYTYDNPVLHMIHYVILHYTYDNPILAWGVFLWFEEINVLMGVLRSALFQEYKLLAFMGWLSF